MVVLVTGFTLGHSLTLALAALDVVRVDSQVVEVLIPVTILVTALLVMSRNRRQGTEPRPARLGASTYLLPLGFGLIHGLGFATYLRSLLGSGESILPPLLWFNLGLEAAQLLVVATVLTLTSVVVDRLLDRRTWQLAIGTLTIAWSAAMIAERLS
ncbi:MAG: HupE/UreJ family protein [Gemmatimonadetes bacterium]|nr:HupE/UreJ family protein [Gemmatimonadota bacterium]